jgi:hypothetical protein
VIGFGCALEALQSWIFQSRFEWVDVVTDACGVLLALLFLTCADAMRKNRHSTPEPCGDPVIQAAGFSQRRPNISLATEKLAAADERGTGAHDRVL